VNKGLGIVVVVGSVVIFAIIAVVIFQLTGADNVEVGPEGVKIGTNPEPDKIEVNVDGNENVAIVTGDYSSVTIQANNERLDEVIQNQKLIFDHLGITSKIDPAKQVEISPEIFNKIEEQSKTINDLQMQLQEFGEIVYIDIDFKLQEMSSYYYVKEYGKMLSLANTILTIEPDNKHALNGKALALYGSGNYDASIKWYDQALEIDQDYIIALNNKGTALYKLGRYSESLVLFEKALEIDPEYVSALNNKGAALYKLGYKEEAKPYFEKALEIDPKYFNSQKWLNKYT